MTIGSRSRYSIRRLPSLLALVSCVSLAVALSGPSALGQITAGPAVAKIVGSVGVGIGPSGVAVDQADGTVWVANLGVGTISELNESSDRVIDTLSVGGNPDAVAADPARGLIWVTDYAVAGGVWEINAATHRVIRRIPASEFPDSLTVDSQAGLLWVANTDIYPTAGGARVILAINEKTGKVVRRVSFGTAATQSTTLGLSAAPVAGLLYVSWISNISEYWVSIVNENTGKKIRTIEVQPAGGQFRYYAIVGAARSGVWIVRSDDFLCWLSTATGKLTRLISLPTVANEPGINYFDPILDQRTNQAWLILGTDKTFDVVIANLRSGAIQAVLKPDHYLQALAVDTRTGRGYVTEYIRGKVIVIQSQAPPAITMPATLPASAGRKARLVIRAAGYPTPTLSKSGTLPPGLTATISRGELLISGVPAKRDRGHDYRITVKATNGLSPSASKVTRIEVR
jgi:hypothetical protein